MAKRGDTRLHLAVRAGDSKEVARIIDDEGSRGLLMSQNQLGETALYVASECGFVDILRDMIRCCDLGTASLKAKNGYDAFHIAARQGNLEILSVISEALPELLMTTDATNTTALHTAASQGHAGVVSFLLGKNSDLAAIARNNGKTALHSAARNGHLEVVKEIMDKDPGIARSVDKKGQTALHMAVKGHSVDLVDAMVKLDPRLANMVDSKGNTALHIAAKKGRAQMLHILLQYKETNKEAINKHGETVFDSAENSGHLKIAEALRNQGVRPAKQIMAPVAPNEFKQTVTDIKHEVHNQIDCHRKTSRRMQHIAKRVNKMHREGINNAINSSTVVAVLIATVAFAAIFSVPGQYIDDPRHVPLGFSLGEAKIAATSEFIMFFIFDSLALFISLAVVVVQTSVVIIERTAKKQMMAIINKLMWLACVFVSVAFIALSFIVVGRNDVWLAVAVAMLGTAIMASTLGVMCYWVVKNRMEASRRRSRRKSSASSRSRSCSVSIVSETEILERE